MMNETRFMVGVLLVVLGMLASQVGGISPGTRSRYGGEVMTKRGLRMLGIEGCEVKPGAPIAPILDRVFEAVCEVFPMPGDRGERES